MLDKLYWIELKRLLKPLSQLATLESLLLNSADFGELINVIFDDLNVLHNLQTLPDSLTEVQTIGEVYFERLNFLVGDGPQITSNAPIHDTKERARLLLETATFLNLMDQIHDEK